MVYTVKMLTAILSCPQIQYNPDMIVILRLAGLVVHDIRSLLKVGDCLDNLNEVSIGFKIRLNDLSHPCLLTVRCTVVELGQR